MKRMFFAFTVMLVSLCVSAQKNGIDAFFNRYAGHDGYTTVDISGNMFNLFADIENDEGEKEITLEITSVRILNMEDKSENGNVNFVRELESTIERGGYEELMMIKDSGNDVRIMAKTKGKVIYEILILTGGKDNALVQIKGRFEKKDLEKLSHVDIDGVSYLERLEEDVN